MRLNAYSTEDKEKKEVIFQFNEFSDNSIDKVFNKHRADDRKKWLENYDRDDVSNINDDKINICDFIDKEMIHFSKYDCDRSIPSGVDGLKISTRKILYAALKRKLYKEIKDRLLRVSLL